MISGVPQTAMDPSEVSQPRTGVTVLVPAFNEEENVERIYERLKSTLEAYGKPFELLFVDDGSTDRTFELLKQIHAGDPRVRVVRFLRNFGQQMAIAAGLRHAQGEYVAILDCDMQSMPEEIPLLVDKLAEGYDIVYGIRHRRKDPLLRRLGSWCMNHLVYRVTGINIPDSVSGFCALDHKFVQSINLFNERSRYLSGLYAWLSYGRYAAVNVTHHPRQAGESKYTLAQLVNITLNFVCNFSEMPLRFATYAGLLQGLLSIIALPVLILALSGLPDPGWLQMALTIDAVAFLFAGQLVFLGIVGEYIARIYIEAKGRPMYLISELVGGVGAPPQ